MKISEQKLCFLRRCKRQQVFPAFILNNLPLKDSLFPVNQTTSTQHHLNRLRTISLNQNISHQYQLISDSKRYLSQFKDRLYHSVDHDIFLRVCAISESNQYHIKAQHKKRLQKKFEWLLSKHYPLLTPPPPLPVQPADERVTTVNCNSVTDTQKSVLALGPNFAVAPKINQEFKDKVAVDLAQCVFKIRHKEALSSQEPAAETSEESEQPTEGTEESNAAKVKRLCPFPSPFTRTPDPTNPELEDKLANFNRFVLNLVETHKHQDNLTRPQKQALHALRSDRSIHVSVSDKCGEFVVTTKETHQTLTEKHLEETAVYQRVLPTRKVQGQTVEVSDPTPQQKTQLIKRKTTQLIQDSNDLWKRVAAQRGLEDDYTRRIKVPDNVSLPVLYVLIKTHKNPPESFRATISLELVKVRPIISCVDSPTERLSWLVTTILKPLLKEIPSHLENLFQHLDTLRSIPKEQLAGRRVFSADISALYTNVNVQGCIEDVIDLATEHREKLDLMGLNLTDVHEILLHILTNSFFVYNHNLWIQRDGLFMGLRPGPFCAVIRVYKFERNSIYTDLHYLSVYLSEFYKRYIDDSTSTAETKEEALALVQSVADQDPDGKLKWEVEFPESSQDFVPFLNTELRIEPDGSVTSRLYRKPQQKDVTLHKNSCHPESVKNNTLANLYSEAEKISSGPQEREHSFKILDDVLTKNGYRDPRNHQKQRRRTNRSTTPDNRTVLNLDFISDSISNRIRNHIKQNNLPIKVTFSPARKLRNILCNNRPYDRKSCTNSSCKICPLLITENKDCEVKNVVYKVKCRICDQIYIGETCRRAHDRLGEHLRYSTFPLTPSNINQAFAIHYSTLHAGLSPDLEFDILKIESNTVRRKIAEAMFILKFNPSINKREELDNIKRFLISSTRSM